MGIKENRPKVTYLIFRCGSTGESFFFHGLIDFILFFFYTGLKKLGSLVSQVLFCLQPGILAMVRLPATSPAQKLIFYYLFLLTAGSPTSVLGSQPIIWLLSPSPSGVRRPEVTKYQHLLITLCDPHSPLTVTFFDG